ncbi:MULTISPECIES: cystatin domain-containing protein [unclassified Carboxylicivirga]|uniref:cystatin domain-containing protein n=1 Tax=Carboxylicivirga TaxID=1628153 RepID=UPI003D33ABDF
MKIRIAILTVFVVVVCSCVNTTQKEKSVNSAVNKEEPERNIVGGWSESEVTPEVEKVIDYVLKEMNTMAKLDKILVVKTQIVKGKNYDIKFKLDNGEVWNTIVYVDLKGNFKMNKIVEWKE